LGTIGKFAFLSRNIGIELSPDLVIQTRRPCDTDIMSSEKYELAQDDLEVALEEIRSSVDKATGRIRSKKMNPEDKRQLVTRCRSKLNDAGSLLKEMEHEARVAPMQYRREMLTKVRHFREEMSRIQHSLQPLTAQVSMGGADLEAAADDRLTPEERMRQQVMMGRDVLERTGQSIERSQQVAIETEEIGGAIVDDLGVQRETLERARGRLQDTNAELSRGRRVVARIKIATVYNKIILIGVIVVEFLIIICIVYFKWIKK